MLSYFDMELLKPVLGRFLEGSAMLQGINADQIFLVYLLECRRELKKKKKESNAYVYHIYCFPVIH